ncbi:MAG: dockerin type I repeat-containing protein, partial [Ruminococcus sp.]|nr:dockerin type I repeat-containing protein [Ruminococcus sp.]
YNIGDEINLTGISVREIYSVDTFRDITDKVIYSYDFSKAGKSNVNVSYILNGNTYKDNFSVTVSGTASGGSAGIGTTFILGDLNTDATLSMSDAVLLQKYLLNLKNLTSEQLQIADINSDGRVNIFDLTLLKASLR